MSDARATFTVGTPAGATRALLLLDATTWVVAIVFAACFRYDFDLSQITWRSVAVTCVFAVVMQIVFGFGTGLYRRRFVSGSFSEIRALFVATLMAGAVVGVPVLVIGFQIHVARSTMLIAFPLALILMATARLVGRLWIESRLRPGGDAKRALIFGSGSLADHLVRRMLTDAASPYVPVGLIDDDPVKRNLRVCGVPVLGTRQQITLAASKSGAEVIIIGVARADGPLLREISDLSTAAGLRVLVLPPLDEVLNGKTSLGDVRDIEIDDILGRHVVDTRVESIAGYLHGRRVLVTGAGGSIGSELCRQITRFSPAELIMLDRDETALQQVQLSISGHGLLDSREVVLADIRDSDALFEIFDGRCPEVVFHAAALKHVPMLEQYPAEAWKTNVLGTQNVLDAARRVGVGTFVNISTDKAATPTSALGHSKYLAERLTAWAARANDARYLSVRFGNVFE